MTWCVDSAFVLLMGHTRMVTRQSLLAQGSSKRDVASLASCTVPAKRQIQRVASFETLMINSGHAYPNECKRHQESP